MVLRTLRIGGAAALAALLSAAAPAFAAGTATVRVGTNAVISDAALFIANDMGFFKEQGIDVTFVAFDSGPKMVAPLGAGQLDVGAGASSAGLFNAVSRGIGIRIVADKGSTIPGHSYMPVLVRKALVDSGEVKTFADLKGRKVAQAGQGGSPGSTLNEALKSGGIAYGDVKHVYNMGYPQHLAALANGAVDASVTTEPTATQAIEAGAAARLPNDDVYPNQAIAVLLYGDAFARKDPETARKFMVAYLKGVRVYNDALADGQVAPGAKGEVLTGVIARNTALKDRALIAKMQMPGNDPEGRVNRASLEKDLNYYREHGFLDRDVSVDQVLDTSFAEAAVKELGPYGAQQAKN